MLDLGSGPGNHAKYFAVQGFDVTCLDISEPLLARCREKRLKTMRRDLEDLKLPPDHYDATGHLPRYFMCREGRFWGLLGS